MDFSLWQGLESSRDWGVEWANSFCNGTCYEALDWDQWDKVMLTFVREIGDDFYYILIWREQFIEEFRIRSWKQIKKLVYKISRLQNW